MAKDDCSVCRYYLGQEIGSCRRYPIYQTRSAKEWCGEFVAKETLPSLSEGVFSGMARELVELPVLSEPPKKKGRPKKC